MQAHMRVWVEDNETVLFSDREAHLLEIVSREGSLAGAAAATGLSYRNAWGLIRRAEAGLGLKLLDSSVGGAGGGRSKLTEAGEHLVARYRDFRNGLASYARSEFARYFDGVALNPLEAQIGEPALAQAARAANGGGAPSGALP